jgi:ADP-heptose:LPS heptosyltransferase
VKIALLRFDKIGDLIASLPCDEIFRCQHVHFEWLISDSVSYLCEQAQPKRKAHTFSLTQKWLSFKKLISVFKAEKYQAVVILYAPWWAYLAAFVARVPVRIGRYSKPESFLFLSHGLRQSRSQSEKHEAEYNWELVQFAAAVLKLSSTTTEALRLPYYSIEVAANRHLFEKFGLRTKEFIVIHPGMAGSARNWPEDNYIQLIEKLIEQGQKVAITGTKLDEKFLQKIKSKFEFHPQVIWLVEQIKLSELLTTLKAAKTVVAPSTGVLHLAAATGTKTIGLFSPVKAHSQTRWKARSENGLTLQPEVDCPGQAKCLGSSCPQWDCMNQISVQQVLANIKPSENI